MNNVQEIVLSVIKASKREGNYDVRSTLASVTARLILITQPDPIDDFLDELRENILECIERDRVIMGR